MFWETLWALILGFALSGAVQAFVSRREMRRLLGDSGVTSLLRATGFGAASSSCSYAAAAMAKSLFADGADFVTAMVFMFASTNLVIELGIVLAVLIGWQFTASELLGGLLMIVLFVAAARLTINPWLVQSARDRLATSGSGGSGQAAPGELPWSVRLRSKALWSAAAGYALADLRMLRKEIAGGFLAAGFLAALVPSGVWRALFLSGHGLGSSIENALIGPLIAMLSFVCSVGNVPLAAALWKGGISFGGVASFIYADLITFPLILIYRKYYGRRLTLRMVGTFWLVMSAAGLATQYLFQALGAIPTTRPHQIALHAFGWNLTTGLDLLALVILGALFVLTRRTPATGESGLYALDPVCGMQVERASAPATLGRGGQQFFFCSDRCRERFERHPDRFFGVAPAAPGAPASAGRLDPVCGMPVDPTGVAPHFDHQGQRLYFCSPTCRDRFQAAPERFRGKSQGADPAPAPEGWSDPVCGMVVLPTSATLGLAHQGEQFYFCSPTCRDQFQENPNSYRRMRTISIPAAATPMAIDPICGMSVDPSDPGATLELPEGPVYFCCQPCADQYASARVVAE